MSTSRVQLALNVTDLVAATAFYEKLFGTPPAKQHPGYVNFAIADPPLKLVLFEDPSATSALNHLGVELASVDDIAAAGARVAAAGLEHRTSQQERCCHAIQDKVWVTAPDVPLNAWELYTVLEDDPTQTEACHNTVCCTSPSASSATNDTSTGSCCS
jgi:extradiol dioxygenase family protein